METFCIFALAFLAGLACQPRRPKPEPPSTPPPAPPVKDLDYIRAMDLIEHMNGIKNRLLVTEDMLTSVTAGNPIKAVWDDGSTYTLTAGHGLAVVERDRLRTLLLADVDELVQLRLSAVTVTVTQTQRGAK